VRLRFRDEQALEGLLVNDLLHLSPHGFLITPPDLNGHQKAFIPRAALSGIEVLAVVPSRGTRQRRQRRPRPEPERQPGLFNE
ncbi:MAG: hypothetical protein ACE5HB_05170, partial [Terriglobia bacterium]